jgi:hypothetical protein
MARFLRLRIRSGTALIFARTDGPGPRGEYHADDELIVPFTEAAGMLRGKGRRRFEIIDVFEDSPSEPSARRRLP